MPQNLRARLLRIRNAKETALPAVNKTAIPGAKPGASLSVPLREDTKRKIDSKVQNPGNSSSWHEAGYKVLSRTLALPFDIPASLPGTLSWLLPDLARNQASAASSTPGSPPSPDQFLFFDLETTGLSGGAGTVAFLAAFGRFVCGTAGTTTQKKIRKDYTCLEITQFLLLDYPGENDFLNKVLAFTSAFGSPFFLTTYNGKAFDTPLLKTRCLMNGLAVPQFLQLDLLHPARRLWKRLLPNCSQATVETGVLGLDRSGDMPGAMAPDIWFNFLRSEEDFLGKETDTSRALSGICDHNVKDIFGLASLFRTFSQIAADPLSAAKHFIVDEENLAMRWRRHSFGQKPEKNVPLAGQEETAALLLKAAAENYPRACLRLAFDLFGQGNYKEGRAALKRLITKTAWKVPVTQTVQAMALRSLAIDAERRLGRRDTARAYIEKALSLAASLPGGLRKDLEKRLG